MFHQARLTLAGILASDDDALDPAAELPLANLGSGAMLLIDTGSNLVLYRDADGAPSESTALDLPAFIDALCTSADSAPALGEAELADLFAPKRPFLGD